MYDNQWALNVNMNSEFNRIQDRLARGGPIMGYNNGLGLNANITTDQSKELSLQLGQYQRRDVAEEYDSNYWMNLNWRPKSNLQIVFGPELSYELDEDQYKLDLQPENDLRDLYSSVYSVGSIFQIW